MWFKNSKDRKCGYTSQNCQFRSHIQNWKIHKNQKSDTLLDIQIYNFFRLQKNQYENFTNFVPPVKFPYWFSFSFYGLWIFYIFQIFCALAKSHSIRFSISCSLQSFFEVYHVMYKVRSHIKVIIIWTICSCITNSF